jgi:hypothetical protein
MGLRESCIPAWPAFRGFQASYFSFKIGMTTRLMTLCRSRGEKPPARHISSGAIIRLSGSVPPMETTKPSDGLFDFGRHNTRGRTFTRSNKGTARNDSRGFGTSYFPRTYPRRMCSHSASKSSHRNNAISFGCSIARQDRTNHRKGRTIGLNGEQQGARL